MGNGCLELLQQYLAEAASEEPLLVIVSQNSHKALDQRLRFLRQFAGWLLAAGIVLLVLGVAIPGMGSSIATLEPYQTIVPAEMVKVTSYSSGTYIPTVWGPISEIRRIGIAVALLIIALIAIYGFHTLRLRLWLVTLAALSAGSMLGAILIAAISAPESHAAAVPPVGTWVLGGPATTSAPIGDRKWELSKCELVFKQQKPLEGPNPSCKSLEGEWAIVEPERIGPMTADQVQFLRAQERYLSIIQTCEIHDPWGMGPAGNTVDCALRNISEDDLRPVHGPDTEDPQHIGKILAGMKGAWHPEFYEERQRLRIMIAFAHKFYPGVDLTNAERMAAMTPWDWIAKCCRSAFIALGSLLLTVGMVLLRNSGRRLSWLASTAAAA